MAQRIMAGIGLVLLLAVLPASSLNLGGIRTAEVSLNDSATARQLSPQLPLALSFDDRMGAAQIAQLPSPLNTDSAEAAREYRAGDIGYVASEQRLIVFTTDGRAAVAADGLVIVGHLTGGFDELAACNRNCAVELSARITD